MVWRRLRVPGSTSLADLHHAIQIVNGWDNEYLHQFHIYGKDYGISYCGGIVFADNAHAVYIDNFEFDIGDKFTYEYNFFQHWLMDIRIEDIDELTPQSFIYCVKGNGMPCATKYDEIEPTLKLLKAITNANKKTTIGDLRPFVEALNAVRFNRYHINYRLQKELTSQK